MAVFRMIEEIGNRLAAPVVAIGNFDGIHFGHRAVFREVVDRARKRGVDSAVLTFEPHPVRFFRPDIPDFRLTTPQQKFELLEACGLEGVIALTFDEAMSQRTPAEFVEEILDRGIHASCVLVGEGFVFGKDRAGDTESLAKLCAARNIETVIVPPVRDENGEIVSSTRIRDAVREGRFDIVEDLLGRHYEIHGQVVHGDARGRDLGFPTANIKPVHPLIPPDGIYAARLEDHELGVVDAAAYVGSRPTFEDAQEGRHVEAFVIDSDQPIDLYEHDVRLHFVGKVRGDRAFDSSEELVEQMKKDVESAKKILEDAGPLR